MKNNVTELVFIVDKSGSMAGLEKDTIGGFNSMLQKQKNEEGVCYISTVFFSELSEVIHNRINIKEVEPLTEKDYVAGGCTALLDALGDAIKHITNVQKYAASDQKADNVIFVIITDGEENSSHKYSIREIKKMISMKQEKYGWEFIFLGANIDAIQTASSYGIKQNRASNFCCDPIGVNLNFCCVSEAISECRADGEISSEWADEIKSDFKKRGK